MSIIKLNKTFSLWEDANLGKVAEINPGLDKSLFNDDLKVSFVPMSAIEEESGLIDVSMEKRFGEVKKGYTLFQENDVLLAKITPCMENGKMAVVPHLLNNLGFGSTEFHVLRCYRGFEPKYLFYFVSSKKFRLNAEHNMTGAVGQRRVPTPYIKEHTIPVPPYAEQRQIVGIIEQLFSDLDNAIDNLKKAKSQLKVYRQAVLKYAFEGKLTEEWRKQNKLSNTNWRDMSVDDIGEVVTGTTPSKKEPKYYGNEYPFYKPGDLDAGYSTDCSVDNLSEAGIKKARLLPVKSVLVTCIGATIGKTGLIRRTGACNQQINAISPNKNVVSEYIYYFAIAPWFQGQIKKTASATTLPILNKTKFQRLMVKVPSVDEQLQIVKEIERRFSICDQFDNISDEQLQRSEDLRQSILKQAFEGKLTEEWRKKHPGLISGENSAKALLEEIKIKRKTLKNTIKRKK